MIWGPLNLGNKKFKFPDAEIKFLNVVEEQI
ncbi:MAG: hypothetical protein Ct9H90mP10_04970 [Actinomycetota bacterium]|nr:MAG: hypothetical protein Ct9H90mP10_04970 [Actinomycetota bacterium]